MAMDPISEARGQLQGALKAAGSRKRDSEWDSSDDDNLIDIQDISAPSVRTVKRRRRKPPAPGSLHDTYVMKLFDRSVNLAQFGPGSALYPVCRAWMANDPAAAAPAPPEDPAEPAEQEADMVYKLPAPLYPPLDERGQPADMRVPTGLRPPEHAKREELRPSKAEDAPPKSQLLAQHLVHWRSVRDKWRSAAANNEQRYAASFAVLRSICVPDS